MRREQRYLRERGYTVKSVGAGTDSEDAFTDEVVTESDSTVVRRIAGQTISVRVYRQLRSTIRDFDPDVVHVHKSQKYPATVALATRGYPSLKTHHDYSTVCPSAWAVKRDTHEVCECGVGPKCWRHGCRSLPVVLGYYVPRHEIQKRIERAIIDRHVAPSETLTGYLQEFGYDARQVRNPQSVADDADPGDGGYVLFVGRLSEEKGVNVLLDAIEELSDGLPSDAVKIAGSGPLESELQDRVDQGRNEAVELLGYVSEEKKADLYANASAVVVPSVWMENYPTVVLEAMAYGKPVIGSDRGGIGEMVEHGETGLLYPALDASVLAEHIRMVLEEPREAERMGENAREWLRETSGYDSFGPAIERVLRELSGTDPPKQTDTKTAEVH